MMVEQEACQPMRALLGLGQIDPPHGRNDDSICRMDDDSICRMDIVATALLCCTCLAGCVRAGFGVAGDGSSTRDALSDGSSFPPEAVFISPTGDDDNPGTRDRPWRTFPVALSRLSPGDTLVALPGVYGAASGTGYLRADCSAGATGCAGGACPNGTAAQPITVMAEQERTAFLKAEIDTGTPLKLASCRHYRLIGLRAENIDDPDGTSAEGNSVDIESCEDVTLRRMLAARPNRYFNSKPVHVARSNNVLVEECEAYNFHSVAFIAIESDNVVLRRNYANSRRVGPIAGGFNESCGNAAEVGSKSGGIYIWWSDGCVVENNVVEDVCNGFIVLGDSNKVAGNMVLGRFAVGYQADSKCGGQVPCTDAGSISRDNSFTDNLSVGGYWGWYLSGAVGTTVAHATAVGYEDMGVFGALASGNQGLAATLEVVASVTASTGAPRGFRIEDQQSFAITYSNAYGNEVDYAPATTEPSNSSYDPQLGGCYVYVPEGSPGKGAGPGGSDVGANIVWRTEDGALTAGRLWDQASGRFPCGATVTGVNDDKTFSDSSCVNVHRRLHLGTGGCAAP